MKLYLRTFGCRANHYDTEAVRAMAEGAGYEIVARAEHADVAVFNSCAVTAEAERDVRKAVRRAAARRPGLRTVVMGCAAALPASAAALRQLPTVEHVVGGADHGAIARALDIAVAPDERGRVTSLDATTRHQDSVRALLRVQDGCDEHCTFCATTLARGANRSREADDLVREARLLAAHHPEIVLTGTHIGSYGLDVGSSLAALVERLVRDVPRVRFRLSSLEATEVDDHLVELFAADSHRLAPHLHAPLQSGSDRLLRRMGRHWYTARTYAAAVERLAVRLPALGLGADLIVGFPGESDADFAATEALVEALPFTYLHVFTYSPRPGTAAMRLPDHVPLGVAQARSAHLRHLGQKKGKEYRAAQSGRTADAIVIGGGPDREVMTGNYLTLPYLGPVRPRGTRFTAALRLDGDSLVAV